MSEWQGHPFYNVKVYEEDEKLPVIVMIKAPDAVVAVGEGKGEFPPPKKKNVLPSPQFAPPLYKILVKPQEKGHFSVQSGQNL